MRRVFAAAVILAGLVLMLYPWLSNYLYQQSVSSTVEVYQDAVKELEDARMEELQLEAEAYNQTLTAARVALTDPFLEACSKEEDQSYEKTLVMDDSGIMCFLEIPKIDLYLPVYHGTDDAVLEKGIGHIEGSSLPIGGEGNHAVLSGHTGVNHAKLFTDLVELAEGDLFFLHVLGRTEAYRVVGVTVITPENTAGLVPEQGRDLVSLLTCTPYGVNTHRLVVTGEATEYSPVLMQEAKEEGDTSGSLWVKAYRKALFAGCLLAALFAGMIRLAEGLLQRKRGRAV